MIALFPEINFEEKVNAESEHLEIEKVEVSNEESLISELPVRHLSKPAYREEFKRDTERSTAAYIDIREDASTGSTSQLPLEAGLERCLLIKNTKKLRLLLMQIMVLTH